MIMSRLGIYASAALTFANLVFANLVLASGMGPAASATEECSQRYKSCNGGCDRAINAVDKVAACKTRCDLRLIACDRQPINASMQGDGYSRPSLRWKGDGSLHPIADGDD
jgi:hypothetical protein